MKIKTNPLNIQQIIELANGVRKTFALTEDDYVPILEIIDTLFEQKMLSYQILDDNDQRFMDGELAYYNYNSNYMYIKESVIEEYDKGIYRSSFTLAHELFHYFQAQVLGFNFEQVEDCKSYEDIEWQANEFAGQLLIPYNKLVNDIDYLEKKYHVSKECASTRLLYAKKRALRKAQQKS